MYSLDQSRVYMTSWPQHEVLGKINHHVVTERERETVRDRERKKERDDTHDIELLTN